LKNVKALAVGKERKVMENIFEEMKMVFKKE